MAGKWIVFEGLDGAGTTTQAHLLSDYLAGRLGGPEQVFSTAEPTRGPFGEICRQALRGQLPLDRGTLALAFSADRSHHLHRVDGILARRDTGCWVVQDRYLYSTLAYQDGPDLDWLRQVSDPFPRPDLLIFLDTPTAVCLERITSRGKAREIFEEQASLDRISQSYQKILERETGRAELLLLDGSEPVDVLQAKIRARLEGWLTA